MPNTKNPRTSARLVLAALVFVLATLMGPSSNAADIIKITDLPIATDGVNGLVYRHPTDPTKCIKIPRGEPFSAKEMALHAAGWNLGAKAGVGVPKTYGWQETNLGLGFVMENVNPGKTKIFLKAADLPFASREAVRAFLQMERTLLARGIAPHDLQGFWDPIKKVFTPIDCDGWDRQVSTYGLRHFSSRSTAPGPVLPPVSSSLPQALQSVLNLEREYGKSLGLLAPRPARTELSEKLYLSEPDIKRLARDLAWRRSTHPYVLGRGLGMTAGTSAGSAALGAWVEEKTGSPLAGTGASVGTSLGAAAAAAKLAGKEAGPAVRNGLKAGAVGAAASLAARTFVTQNEFQQDCFEYAFAVRSGAAGGGPVGALYAVVATGASKLTDASMRYWYAWCKSAELDRTRLRQKAGR